MQTITRQQAEEIFASIQGCAFVGITTTTVPRLSKGKSNPHQGRVVKHTTARIFCGEKVTFKTIIENKAFKQYRENEGFDLTSEQIEVVPTRIEGLWNGCGERLKGAVIRHGETDARYINVYYPKSGKPSIDKKLRPTVRYTLDGNPIAKDDIEGLQESKVTVKTLTIKVTDDNGNVTEKEVDVLTVPRVYKLESLVAFRHNGEEYEVLAEVEGGEIAEADREESREEPREQQA